MEQEAAEWVDAPIGFLLFFVFFFARAKLGNVLWVAKMRDGVRVPRCSRSDIHKFHRAFVILINRGSADRLRRDNQF